MPNGIKSYPLKDLNGRNTGKELKDVNGNRVYGEYISYVKVGDHATNMPSAVWYANGNVIRDNVKYKYDDCGNITEISENGKLSARYKYDSLNRLEREDNKKFGKTWIYTYDNCGNITSKREFVFTLRGGEQLEELESTDRNYRYDGDKLQEYNEEIISYETYGTPIKYKGETLEWEYGKRLKKYGEKTFGYDGLGRRISKGETTFTYDNEGRLIKQSNGIEFIYDNDGIAGLKYNGTDYIYRKNVLGDITHILDMNGNVVEEYAYDAWGNCAIVKDTAGIAEVNPYRYRGYYYDVETKLYYLKTRYYDPEVGRFISQDDVSYLDPEHINGLNLYAYCLNNPIMGVDPTGTFVLLSFLIGLGIATAIGAAVGAVSYVASEAISYAITGEWSWSWGAFLGSVVGGAIGGALSFAVPGLGIVGSAAITGGLSTALGMTFENALGEANHSVLDIFVSTISSAAMSALFAGVTKNIKIPKFTGRGSISQVARQISTKFYNGTISRVSLSTVGKMFVYQASYNVFSTVANGIIDAHNQLQYIKKHSIPVVAPYRTPYNLLYN